MTSTHCDEETSSDVSDDDSEDTEYSDAEAEALETSEDEELENDPSNLSGSSILTVSDDESEKLYISKDQQIMWSSKSPPASKTQVTNVVTAKAVVKAPAKDAKSVMECWELFFPPKTIERIVHHTNEKLDAMRNNYKRDVDCVPTTVCEMRAFLGLLYFSGLLKLSHIDIHDLWKKNGLAPEYFRATMRENRFKLLLKALRFDEGATRLERRKTDKMAPIRDIWDEFNARCLEFYSPGENVTIDEMIAAFRGRCSFKQYIPSKPDKYGLKIFAMVNSTNWYTSSMELYVGQQPTPDRQLSNKPFDVVKRVCSSILNTGRNITMDNWFSSIPLAIDLAEKHKTTMVATLRKDKTEIPPPFLAVKERECCSSMFGHYRGLTMTSYVSKSKKKKCTILLSSMHNDNAIDDGSGEDLKPEIITYYNKTKGAVDTVDWMRGKYNVARTSRRWPLTLFFVIMNIAVINAKVIYNQNMPKTIKRKQFIETLFTELTRPLLIARLEKPEISWDLRQIIRKCLKLPAVEPGKVVEANETGRCAYCPKKKNRKTKSACTSCSNLICTEHTVKMCAECYKQLVNYED